MLGGVDKAGGHKDRDGQAEHAQQDVHPHLQGRRLVRVRRVDKTVAAATVEGHVDLAAPAVVVAQRNVGEDLADAAHVDRFDAVAAVVVGVVLALPLLVATAATFLLFAAAVGGAGGGCFDGDKVGGDGERRLDLVVALVGQLEGHRQQLALALAHGNHSEHKKIIKTQLIYIVLLAFETILEFYTSITFLYTMHI